MPAEVRGARKALVRRPSPRLAEGIVTNIERQSVDAALAREQWSRYVETFEAAGWEMVEIPPTDDCPDGVFIEDTLVVYRDVAVIARPGADSRLPEIVEAEHAVEALGFSVSRITAPGTLDGGDVLKVGDTIYAGRGARTNAEGICQLGAILEPLGANVIAVPVRHVLHLKSAVTSLPDGLLIGYPPLLESPALFPRLVAVPEPSGANVVQLGEANLLLAADCPKSAELVAGLGYEPVIVDIGEFQKLEAGVTCLSVRLRGLPG